MPDITTVVINTQITGFTSPDLIHVSVLNTDNELWEVGKVKLGASLGKKFQSIVDGKSGEEIAENKLIVLVKADGWNDDAWSLNNPQYQEKAKVSVKAPEIVDFDNIPRSKIAVSAAPADNTVEETPETQVTVLGPPHDALIIVEPVMEEEPTPEPVAEVEKPKRRSRAKKTTQEEPAAEEPTSEPVAEEEKSTSEPVAEEEKSTPEPVAEEEKSTPEPVAEEKKPRQSRAKKTTQEEPATEAPAAVGPKKASGTTRQANMKALLEGKAWKIQDEGWSEESIVSTSGFSLKHWYRIVVEETGETAVVGRGELIEYAGIRPQRKRRTTTVTTAKSSFRSFFADSEGPVGKAGELPEITVEMTSELETDGLVAVAEALQEEPTSEPEKPKRQRRKKAQEEPVAEAPVAEAPVAEAPVAEAPVAEAPVEEEPVEEEPVAEEPVAEAPVAEAPVEEAPVAKEKKPRKSRAKTTKEPEPAAELPTEEADEGLIDLEALIKSAEETEGPLEAEGLLNPTEEELTISSAKGDAAEEEEMSDADVDLSFIDG